MSSNVYIVSTGTDVQFAIQAIFTDKHLADDFVAEFVDARVDVEELFDAMPAIYCFECRMSISSGNVLVEKRCTPTLYSLSLQLSPDAVLAIGTTEHNAREAAKEYCEKIKDFYNNNTVEK